MKATSTFFPIVQIAGFLFLFASFGSCKKSNNNHSNPNPLDSLLKDSGTVSMQLENISYQSLHALEATDQQGFVYITAYFVRSGNDTSAIALTFPDTLSVNTPYRDTTGFLYNVEYRDFQQGEPYRSPYNQATDPLILTSFDKNAHTISGVFSGQLFPQGDPREAPFQLSNGVFNTTYTLVSP